MSVCRMAGGSQGSRACLLTASALRKNGVSKGKGVVRARFSLPLLISHPMSFPSTTAPAKPKVDVCCVLLRCSCPPLYSPWFCARRRLWCTVCSIRFPCSLQLQVLFCVFLLEISSARKYYRCCSLIFAHLCLLFMAVFSSLIPDPRQQPREFMAL
jgi:hypothetical protein